MTEIVLKFAVDGKEINTTLQLTDEELKKIRGSSRTVTDEISKWGMITMGFNQSLELAKKVFNVISKPLGDAGQFEQYETALKVMLGSTEKAQARLEELVEFAATTPFELPQVVNAANQLQALGKYSQDNLRMLGDLASASGKPMEQALSAYAKMVTGQKGIAVDMFRDLLITVDDWSQATGKKIGKNGELQATVKEMAAALPKIIKEKGFAGMMDEQSKTLLGMGSNFQDALGQLSQGLGEKVLPIAKDVLTVIIPALSGLKNNLDIILPIVGALVVTFVAYQVAINGVTAAKQAAAVVTRLLTTNMNALKVAMATNPIGLIVVAFTAATAAAYAFNEVYGDTIENQGKAVTASKKANEAEQKRIKTQIDVKNKTAENASEYERLYQQYQKTVKGTDEHRKAEIELHNILTEQQKLYPGLITNTYDYSKGLDEIKKASAQSVIDVSRLTGELTKQQKALVDIQLAGANIDLYEAAHEVIKETSVNDNFETFSKIILDMKSGKKTLSELLPQVRELQSKYAGWAAMGGDKQQYNYEMANKLTTLLDAMQKKIDLFKMKNSGKGIDVLDSEPTEDNETPSTETDDSFKKNLAKELEDINKKNQEKLEIEKAANTEYLELQEQRLKKMEELKLIELKIKNAGSQDELDKLKLDRDYAQQSIKIIDDTLKEKEDALSKEMDAFRKANADKIKYEEEIARKEKEIAVEVADMKTEAMEDGLAKDESALNNWYAEQKKKYKGHKQALDAIDKLYEKKKEKIDEESAQHNIDMTNQMFDYVTGISAEHTAAYKLAAGAKVYMATKEAAVESYKWGASWGGPIAGAIMAAIATAYGVKQEADIMSKGIKGYVKGGLIRVNEEGQEYIVNAQSTKNNLGLLEAINNNRTSDFRRSIIDSILNVNNVFGSIPVNDNGKLYDEIKKLNKNFEKYADRPIESPVAIGDDACRKITQTGLGRMKRLKL